MTNVRMLYVCLFGALIPSMLMGFSTGPPVRRTGAAVDGPANCAGCHRTFAPANSDGTGRIMILAAGYKPGEKQVIRVRVSHPLALRWGFQLTARLANDETKPAGTFTPNDLIRVECGTTGDSPCNGATEFASHRSAPRTPEAPGSYTFDVEWTPPADATGEIMLYAAGNAANGDGANAGDRIYTTATKILPAAACDFRGLPLVTSVVNAASQGSDLTENTVMAIRGSGFTLLNRDPQVGVQDLVNGRYPSNFSCLAVEVNGVRAPVISVEPEQIIAQTPTLEMVGPVNVQVILNPDLPGELRSTTVGSQFRAYAPGFFTLAGTRSIAARTANGGVIGSASVTPVARPARPGAVDSLFGTGFGRVKSPTRRQSCGTNTPSASVASC
ncbi:MAG: hypothetical protein NTY38_32095 [Acidobacteria bacterium]|nr:hypothetical protein [Acidobacteriota bacterium]